MGMFEQKNTIKEEAKVKRNYTLKTILIINLVLFIGMSGSAFAYRGWGMGQRGHGYPGYESNQGGQGYGYGKGILEEQDFEKLNGQRQKYHQEIESLRSDINLKELEMRKELSKENPDVEKLKSLQAEISGLVSQLDQKRLEFQLEARKIIPNAERGYAMGYGPRGGGCWR